MFVRWECGCVGISGELYGNGAIVIRPCDEDRDTPRESLSWGRRDMAGKSMTPLSVDAEQEMHRRLGSRLWKADRFDQLRVALGVPEEAV